MTIVVHETTVSSRMRIVVPKEIRNEFPWLQNTDGVDLVSRLGHYGSEQTGEIKRRFENLIVYPHMPISAQLEARIRAISRSQAISDEKKLAILTLLSHEYRPAKMDSAGRLNLASEALSYLSLKTEGTPVTVVGTDKQMQIWQKDVFEEYMEHVRTEQFEELILDDGIDLQLKFDNVETIPVRDR